MNRIEKVREVVDAILLDITDNEERRCAYLHLYGVSQGCALLARKRKENVELAVIAGMLHDIYAYAKMAADVMQHVLYNPLFEIKEHEQERFAFLVDELGLDR